MKVVGTMDVAAIVVYINDKLSRTVELTTPGKNGDNVKTKKVQGDRHQGGGPIHGVRGGFHGYHRDLSVGSGSRAPRYNLLGARPVSRGLHHHPLVPAIHAIGVEGGWRRGPLGVEGSGKKGEIGVLV
jgi:hypothetical protein